MWKEKDLLRLPAEIMPLEQCALLREYLTAYRLLEDSSSLKVPMGGWIGVGGRALGSLGMRASLWSCFLLPKHALWFVLLSACCSC